MTATILQMNDFRPKAKPRLVYPMLGQRLDSFGRPVDEPRENNLRPDSNPIIPCRLPTKGDLA